MRWLNALSAWAARRPRKRLALDAVLFLGAGVAVGWSGVRGVTDGRLALGGGDGISLTHTPGLFWAAAALYGLVTAACLAVGAAAGWVARRRGSDEE